MSELVAYPANIRTLADILSSMIKMQEIVSTCTKLILPTVKYAYCDLLNQLVAGIKAIPKNSIPTIETEDPLVEESYSECVLQYCMNAIAVQCKDGDRYTIDTVDDVLNRLRYGGWTTLYEYQREERWNEPTPYRIQMEDIPKDELPTDKEIAEYEHWANEAAEKCSVQDKFVEDGVYRTDEQLIEMYMENFGEQWR